MRSLNILLLASALFTVTTARSQSNFLFLLSSPSGDALGNGANDITADPAAFLVSGPPSAIQISALNQYLISFGGPGGEDLTVGDYTNATHYPSNGPLPGIDIVNTRLHVSCSANCGTFFIKEIHADTNGQVDRLWVTFTNWCSCSSTGSLAGEIRFNSQLADLAAVYINCPSNVTAVTPFGQNLTVVDYPLPTGTPGGWISSFPPPGSVFWAGTNMVHATLLYGTNTMDCDFPINVQVAPFVAANIQKQPYYNQTEPLFEAPYPFTLVLMATTDVFETITNITLLSSGKVMFVDTDVLPTSTPGEYLTYHHFNVPAGFYEFQEIAQNSSGILATSAVQNIIAISNVLKNGTFESRPPTNWTVVGTPNTPTDIYNALFYYQSYPIYHSGWGGFALGDIKIASLSQRVQTVPDQDYLLFFWLINYKPGPNQIFSISWNPNNAETNVLLSLTNPGTFPWTKHAFLLKGSTTNTTIQVLAENDASYFGLDDVFLVAIPPLSFATSALSPDGFHLSWPTAPGIAYQVQYTTNLLHPNWTDLVPPFIASRETYTVVDTNLPSATQRFYRLVLP
jgi:hypothetical protein